LLRAGAHEGEALEIARAGNERFLDVGDAIDVAEVAGFAAPNVQR
jgi:hypothetical protein